MPEKLSISAVIPNYNGRELLKRNIPFLLKALEIQKIQFEIIVSDDASTDDSIDFLKKEFPQVIIISSPENKGFSHTANAGIFACKKELIFIVNSDVLVTEQYFTNQFKYFSSNDTFGVMGRIVGLDNDNLQDGAKTQYRYGLKIGDNINLIPTGPSETWFPTLYLSGANALVKRDMVFKLNGFDEIYSPFYGEDLDLSLRAWKVGWKCFYDHESICRHPNSVTINKYHKKKKIKRVVYRNRFIMHEIHLKGMDKILWNLWIFLQLFFKVLVFNKIYVLGFKDYLRKKQACKTSEKKLLKLGMEEGQILSNREVYRYLRVQFKNIPHIVK